MYSTAQIYYHYYYYLYLRNFILQLASSNSTEKNILVQKKNMVTKLSPNFDTIYTES